MGKPAILRILTEFWGLVAREEGSDILFLVFLIQVVGIGGSLIGHGQVGMQYGPTAPQWCRGDLRDLFYLDDEE